MNLFDLYAKITLDDSDYKKKLGEAETEGSSFASKLGSGLGKAAKVTATATAAAGAAAASGVVAIAKSAIENYADYEQLVGGVETLFKDSSDEVVKYASNAYKTAGMSANDYMETVTSFSASLLQSLGGDTAAAAGYADQAITDMADNANKMGTDISMIQNAYQGFAKQNYTMLDNLKLGYGGTKEEMQRLIDDANAVKVANGEMADLTIDSFADVTEAIHIVQNEMGITGATAAEAEGTISGSVASMKSAWTNLVTGLGDENANLDELIGNFVESAATAAENLLERADVVLSGIGSAVEKIAPVIIEKIPYIITDVLPSLLNAGKELLSGLVRGILDNAEALMASAVDLVDFLADAIIDMLPEILELGIRLVIELAAGLLEAIPDLVAKIPEIITAMVKGFTAAWPRLKEVGKDMIRGLWEGIKAMGSWIKEKVGDFFGGIVDGVKGLLGIHSPSKVFAGIGGFMAEGLGEGWDDEYANIKKHIEGGLEFEAANVGFDTSAMGKGNASLAEKIQNAVSVIGEGATIVVQSVLDGKVIGETSYQYSKNKLKAYGG